MTVGAVWGNDPADVVAANETTVDDLLAWHRPAWHADAACARPENADVDFFPRRGRVPFETVMVCGRCRVIDECLQYAIDNGIEYGVWGGLSARARPGGPARNVARADERRRQIRSMRARGMTRDEIAAALGVHVRTVSRARRARDA